MEMRAQLVAEQQRFHTLANALLDPINAQDTDIEHLLLDVICTLTQSVVERELLTDSSHIVSLVKNAVDALPIGSKNIRVCLNPDDLAAVETYVAEQQLAWSFLAMGNCCPAVAGLKHRKAAWTFRCHRVCKPCWNNLFHQAIGKW